MIVDRDRCTNIGVGAALWGITHQNGISQGIDRIGQHHVVAVMFQRF